MELNVACSHINMHDESVSSVTQCQMPSAVQAWALANVGGGATHSARVRRRCSRALPPPLRMLDLERRLG